jgi:hypothetical protein
MRLRDEEGRHGQRVQRHAPERGHRFLRRFDDRFVLAIERGVQQHRHAGTRIEALQQARSSGSSSGPTVCRRAVPSTWVIAGRRPAPSGRTGAANCMKGDGPGRSNQRRHALPAPPAPAGGTIRAA